MVVKLVKRIIGSRNDRVVKTLSKAVKKINVFEADFEVLSDEQLAEKTGEFKQRLTDSETLDELLPEAFAVVREAGKRALGMRHFDVQLIGGMALHQGKISEMRTGEGKTLVATLAAYLNALSGQGVHVVTVNDYLAKRDSEWMSRLYGFLGLTTGVVTGGMDHEQRKEAYDADITYATNNELGFDYLRDNMVFRLDQKVQRPLNYAIVDEVDSILIDEARTPLIISGPVEGGSDKYSSINKIIPLLTRQDMPEGKAYELEMDEESGDYFVDEKARQIHLTESGHHTIEQLLTEHQLLSEGESLYAASSIGLLHHVNSALRAHVLFQKNVDYIVSNSEIVIVDEFTGRTMPGRRWSEGLHQAVEAKEGVTIQQENQTLASITFQNYFRLYNKISGMTGTADTEAPEFLQIYGLEVIVIPTHREMVRKDMGDLVFLTGTEKYQAILEDIKDCLERKQPVLVGTASIDSSEYLSDLLKKEKIHHEVLNAKQHDREAIIIAQAGAPGALTIATNMAGRGTDIVLGGNLDVELAALEGQPEEKLQQQRDDWNARHQQVLDSGGLHVIGTERNESRRVDNQLRGRSGRQGDSGSTRFYLSLEDNLMRIFASDRVSAIMQKLGMEEGEAIEHPWVTKAIANAQRKVEARNFDIRKQLLEYDDVANEQRIVIYEQRDALMGEEDIAELVEQSQDDVVSELVAQYVPANSLEEQWQIEPLVEVLKTDLLVDLPLRSWLDEDSHLDQQGLQQKVNEAYRQSYLEKEEQAGAEIFRQLEKGIMLQMLDSSWKEHLASMDYLRQGIHLRGYAQKNPKQEFKREAYEMFSQMLEGIKREVVMTLSKVQIQSEQELESIEQSELPENANYTHEQVSSLEAPEEIPTGDAEPFVREGAKVGRNDPCPCGSGKKYKKCHGQLN